MRIAALALGLGLSLFGCPKKEAEPKPVERTTPIAAGAPLHLDQPDRARMDLDLSNLRDALHKHQQIEGGFPARIEQLGVRLAYPADIEYDAASGTVKSKTYPML